LHVCGEALSIEFGNEIPHRGSVIENVLYTNPKPNPLTGHLLDLAQAFVLSKDRMGGI
jgi:hypothetical protein